MIRRSVLLFLVLSVQCDNFSCIKAGSLLVHDFIQINSDMNIHGRQFNKLLLLNAFRSTREIFKECKGYVPRILTNELCFKYLDRLLVDFDNLDKLIQSRRLEEAVAGIDPFTMMQFKMVKVCLNPKTPGDIFQSLFTKIFQL